MNDWENRIREALGPGFDEEAVRELVALTEERLEANVGVRLAEGLTDEQLDEFEQVLEDDHEAALHWLEQNCPDYRQTVADERERLLRKVAMIDG